jgi:hypothetical protein
VTKVITVSVADDYLASLARPARSVDGIVEMIWNGLDAEADHVQVTLTRDELDGVAGITVVDNGHGMAPDEIETDFHQLGGSWKREARRSRNEGRILHGQAGKGRWRAFSIGGVVQWVTVAEVDGRNVKTTITGLAGEPKVFRVDDPADTTDPIGTTVIIDNVHPVAAAAAVAEDAGDRILAQLALYLERYPSASVHYRGSRLDPAALQEHRAEYELDSPLEYDSDPPRLTVIEWSKPVSRELLICDEHGMALHVEHPGIHAPEFDFTAYISWHEFREHEAELVAIEMHPVLGPVLENARDQLREHFRERTVELKPAVLEEWKEQHVYPYEGEAQSEVERVEREFFDVVAFTAAKAVNATADTRARKLSLRLLRQSIEQSPEELRNVLNEVLELPRERLDELNSLLEHTSLDAIISLAKEVADRLDFVTGLREIVFEEASADVLERRHLHKILERETWIFGDEYTLAVTDESLTSALRAHIEILGRDDLVTEPVRTADGRVRRLDLMLAAAIPLPTRQREHLVVELKRPDLVLGAAELTQVSEYALAVATDPRFDNVDVRWNFWLVGTEMNDYVAGQARQPNRSPGIVSEPLGGRVTIWAKTWAEILAECDHRLKFVRERLEYRTTTDAGVAYLRQKHAEYLPEALREELVVPDA